MSDARLAGLLFLVSLLARIVACMGLVCFGPDSPNFLTMADWMREGHFREALPIAYHPVYPLLIAIAAPLAGGSVSAGHAVSVVLGAAASVPLFFIARELFERRAACLATLMYALQPRMVDTQADIMSDSTFMFFFLTSVWLTWRMGEEPTLARGVTLALAASAAYLTRLEGFLVIVLAIAWPLFEAGRTKRLAFLGPVLVTFLTITVVIFPYLVWVKAQRGEWSLSIRPSMVNTERALGLDIMTNQSKGEDPKGSVMYLMYLQSVIRLSLYGVLFPFYVLGALEFRKAGWRKVLFFLAYVGGLLGGVFFALRKHAGMSDRYIMVAMALALAPAAAGMVSAFDWASRRWPAARWRPAVCWTVLVLIVVLPAFRWLHVRRSEDRSYAVAAQRIVSRPRRAGGVSGIAQVAYLAGAKPIFPPKNRAEAILQIQENQVGCFVYDERDIKALPAMVAMLNSSEFLEPPEEIEGPPGTLKVYVQFVR
jgi:4-amino-4-deoxy-L-arabinose transferase-like glycosyltransferase